MKPRNAGLSADKLAFIVFSDDWGVHPSSSQHIFKIIAVEDIVAWVNTLGMRRPTFTRHDAIKAVRKLSGMFSRNRQSLVDSQMDVQVLQPKMIPFNDIPAVRRWNGKSVARSLKMLARDPSLRDPIIVTTVPNACDYVDAVPHRAIIYYCVDDFSEWPGLDKALILEMEEMLVRKSDAFIASSEALYSRLSATGKPSLLLTHGVDLEHFSAEVTSEHQVLDDIPKPRAGYFGLFDARSDQQLILDVARQRRDWSFVVAGRVEADVSEMKSERNIYFVGQIQYEDLPKFAAGLDSLFIPYRVNKLTEALSPLKFKEYLATGKPIISTPISAASEFSSFIDIADDAADWSRILQLRLSDADPGRKAAIDEFLRDETWPSKARQFAEFCRATGGVVEGSRSGVRI